jgi:hypothetical protein
MPGTRIPHDHHCASAEVSTLGRLVFCPNWGRAKITAIAVQKTTETIDHLRALFIMACLAILTDGIR